MTFASGVLNQGSLNEDFRVGSSPACAMNTPVSGEAMNSMNFQAASGFLLCFPRARFQPITLTCAFLPFS